MLKDILEIDGVKKMNKTEQKSLQGGGGGEDGCIQRGNKCYYVGYRLYIPGKCPRYCEIY